MNAGSRRRTADGVRWRARAPVGAVLAAALLGACNDTDDTTQPETCGTEVAEIRFQVDEPLTLVRVGGGTRLRPELFDECDRTVGVLPEAVTWSSSDPEVVTVAPVSGALEPEAFVRSESFGTVVISAESGDARGDLDVQVLRPPTDASGFTVVDSGAVELSTTDLWVHGNHVYSGSQPWSCGGACEGLSGWLYVWRIGSGGGLDRVDSLALPAVKINDIKVSADGSFAVASQERGVGNDNGIVVLDLADPGAPTVAATHAVDLERGVHNVWIERIAGRDYVFTAENGSATAGGLHVIDVTDRAAPTEVASFHAGSSIVHDVYVRDGLAFVSHWDAGLVILDVGHGMADGSPENPVEISRVVTDGGHVHNAWYWPDGEVVFVGEERFPPPEMADQVGELHVVDVSDLTAPVEVASLRVPGATPHNFWLDEDRGILFAAWYTNGVRALDVTGTLSGDLGAQGRELGHVLPSGFRGAGSIWAPQLHDGVIYLSDIYNGLWAVRYDR